MNNLSLNKTTLKQLYGKGLSMSEIAQIQQCSVHKIVYWMNKYRIDRRSRSEALYRRLNPFGDPFQIKNNLTQKDLFLKGLGLGIYWGEGNKVSPYVISVTNTDPFMLQSFILFLKVICSVKSEKIGLIRGTCKNLSMLTSIILFRGFFGYISQVVLFGHKKTRL